MICLVYRRGQLWFCVAGAVCVRSYPQAVRLMRGE